MIGGNFVDNKRITFKNVYNLGKTKSYKTQQRE